MTVRVQWNREQRPLANHDPERNEFISALITALLAFAFMTWTLTGWLS